MVLGVETLSFVCVFDILVPCHIQHKCFMVATCDRDLKRRIRKVNDRSMR